MTKLLPILLILLLSFSTKFIFLTKYPDSFFQDELAIAYNAYSILKTGQDEWGHPFPLAFESVGDYKPPINVYLTSLSFLIFGYNEWAVRFPSALFGSLTPVIFYFLLKKLKFSNLSSLISSLWLSLLPWHIYMSRTSYEAITALALMSFGILGLINWFTHHQKKWLYLATISLSLSVWAYHAQRVVVPLISLGLLLIYRHQFEFKKHQKTYLKSFLILSLFLLPFLYLFISSPAIKARGETTSVLKDPVLLAKIENTHSPLAITYLKFNHWFQKYLEYFDLRYWFRTGLSFTPPNHPDFGLLYPHDLIIITLSLLFFIKTKNKKIKQITLLLLLISPLPASLTMSQQHSLRALTMLSFFPILIATGWQSAINKKLTIIFILYPALLIFYFIKFIDIITIQSPYHFSEYRQYSQKEISLYACQHYDQYDHIILPIVYGSNGPLSVGLPYLYYLFYCQTDPATYIKNQQSIPKVEFKRTNWNIEKNRPNSLIITTIWDIVETPEAKNHIIKELYYKNGKSAFIVLDTNHVQN